MYNKKVELQFSHQEKKMDVNGFFAIELKMEKI